MEILVIFVEATWVLSDSNRGHFNNWTFKKKKKKKSLLYDQKFCNPSGTAKSDKKTQ